MDTADKEGMLQTAIKHPPAPTSPYLSFRPFDVDDRNRTLYKDFIQYDNKLLDS
jgi:hypothetical protein